MAKAKTVFFCTNCGNESPKWQGRCPACGAWNTYEEHIEKPTLPGKAKSSPVGQSRKPQRIQDVTTDGEIRFSTGMGELDRVLGGGAVAGSLVLVGGAPGIGKSTLLLQICNSLCAGRSVLYVSGEESERQLKLRAQRLGVAPESLYILSETRLSDILEAVEELKPYILMIDSIQTLYREENDSSPGSVSQVKDCTMTMMHLSKSQGITVFVVGHINKDGNIAGPKVLEHMVDCVLYFEGERRQNCRLIRAIKNRFGSTNEIGVFEMTDEGLREVDNPSAMLLSDRPQNVSGNCAVCVVEGTRPIVAEIQALATNTVFPAPRRTSNGIDYNRAALILAVLEKRLGLRFSSVDVYLNVIGGIRIEETASDVGVALALISSVRDIPVPDELLCIGELGLSGEVRAVSHIESRVTEAARLGFKKIILPSRSAKSVRKVPDGVTLIPIKSIFEVLTILK